MSKKVSRISTDFLQKTIFEPINYYNDSISIDKGLPQILADSVNDALRNSNTLWFYDENKEEDIGLIVWDFKRRTYFRNLGQDIKLCFEKRLYQMRDNAMKCNDEVLEIIKNMIYAQIAFCAKELFWIGCGLGLGRILAGGVKILSAKAAAEAITKQRVLTAAAQKMATQITSSNAFKNAIKKFLNGKSLDKISIISNRRLKMILEDVRMLFNKPEMTKNEARVLLTKIFGSNLKEMIKAGSVPVKNVATTTVIEGFISKVASLIPMEMTGQLHVLATSSAGVVKGATEYATLPAAKIASENDVFPEDSIFNWMDWDYIREKKMDISEKEWNPWYEGLNDVFPKKDGYPAIGDVEYFWGLNLDSMLSMVPIVNVAQSLVSCDLSLLIIFMLIPILDRAFDWEKEIKIHALVKIKDILDDFDNMINDNKIDNLIMNLANHSEINTPFSRDGDKLVFIN